MKFPEWQNDSCIVTTDPSRIDVAAALTLLHATHWGAYLTRATLEKAMQHSIVFAVLAGQEMVGFARVVTDRATFAYLCDVMVAPAHRGQGLGQWMVECVLEHPYLQGLRRFSLLTRTARTLYERVGFSTDTAGAFYLERRSAPPATEPPG